MSASGYVHLENCKLMARTDRAALIAYAGAEHWIPFSQMAQGEAEKLDGIAPRRGPAFTLSVTDWICEQKGIEGDG